MNPEESKKNIPPYLPFATLDNFFSELREQAVMPSEIDRSFLRKKSGSVQSWLPSALAFLGLLDEKRPNRRLEELVRATDEQRTGLYHELVYDKFADLFARVDVKSGTTQQLAGWFKEFGMAPTTVDRCVAFFLDLCKRAEVEVSPYFEKTSSRRSTSRKRNGKKVVQEGPSVDSSPKLLKSRPSALENTLLLGLVEQLPSPGEAFPKADRENWLALVPLILTSVYGPPDE